ncbi:MAG: permease-like cell division protein FtsX [Bacteroidales bacterium]|nr:permease-like cell division protein FtsX [Bacteroidales bacterium]
MEQTEIQQPLKNKAYRRKVITSYFTSTLCIALVLYMAGLFFMLLFNTQHISEMFRSTIRMTVTLNDRNTKADNNELIKRIEAKDFAKETKYIDKEDGVEELIEELGEDFVEILDGENPLFSQIEIRIAEDYANMDSIKAVEKYLSKLHGVDDVYYPKDIWNNATTVISNVAMIVLVLTIILLIITIILISNCIKLQMSNDRFDIRTAKLIGASNWKISSPYLKKSFLQSLAAILLSVAGLTLTIKFIEKILKGVFTISSFYPTLLTMMIIGMTVTLLASVITINKYLNAKEEELYY